MVLEVVDENGQKQAEQNLVTNIRAHRFLELGFLSKMQPYLLVLEVVDQDGQTQIEQNLVTDDRV